MEVKMAEKETMDEKVARSNERQEKVMPWVFSILTILIMVGLMFATAVMTNKI